jgi:hypothetical protein
MYNDPHHRYLCSDSRFLWSPNPSAPDFFCAGQHPWPAEKVDHCRSDISLSTIVPLSHPFTGNLAQFHDPDDWAFQHELEENYAQVVKIHGILGVGTVTGEMQS